MHGSPQHILSSVAPSYDKHAWFANYGVSEIARVNKVGAIRQSVQLEDKITHLVEDSDRGLLVAYDNGHCLKRIAQTGKTTVVYDASPDFTRGMCVSDDGESILLCCSSDKASCILSISLGGDLLHEYKKDEDGQRLFQYAYHVVENINNDICATDIDSGCVVAFNRKSKVRFRYTGATLPDTMCRFTPYGLARTSVGHLVVSDHLNHCVHIIDSRGTFISFLLTHAYRVQYPIALASDDDDNVWVACKNGDVIVCSFF